MFMMQRVPPNGEGLCCIFSFQFEARLALTIQLCTVQNVDMIIFYWHSMAPYGMSNCNEVGLQMKD